MRTALQRKSDEVERARREVGVNTQTVKYELPPQPVHP